MKLVYSRRALADLNEIASAGWVMSLTVFAEHPRLLRAYRNALTSRVVAVVRYPFRIFYRVRNDAIDILHIRHTSRRPSLPSSETS